MVNPTETTPESSPPPVNVTEPAWRRHPVVRFGLPFVAIALIAAAIVLLSNPFEETPEPGNAAVDAARLGALEDGVPRKGEPAPDFALRSLDGNVIRLSELRGRPVLVNFWATWCGPCRDEMPDLEAVYQLQKDDLVIVAVNVEGTGQDEARRLSRDFAEELGLSFLVVLDTPDGAVFSQYKLRGLPDSFFVDASGVIREVTFGPMNRDTILRKLETTRRAQ